MTLRLDNPTMHGSSDPSGQPTGDKKVWAGKYASPEEMERGLMHMIPEMERLGKTNKALQEQNGQLLERVEAILPLIESASSGKPSGGSTAIDTLAEALNTDRTTLVAAIREIAGPVANEAVDGKLTPFVDGISARGTIASSNPDFVQNESKIYEFVNASPEVRRNFDAMRNTSHEAALRYAHMEWRIANPSREGADGAENAAAMLDSAHRGGSHGSGPGKQTAELQLETLKKAAAAFKANPTRANYNTLVNLGFGGQIG